MEVSAVQEEQMKADATKKLKDAKNPVEKLRLQCLQRGVCGIKSFARSFQIMDDNADRRLNREELFKGCTDYGLDLEKEEFDEIFETFDRDHNGSIDFDEFLRALRPPMSEARLNLIHAAFKKLDKTGDGIITVDDLKGVYNVKENPKYINGEMTEAELLRVFLDNFDSQDKDGKITKEEFENYYAGVSASIDMDLYFDLMMRKAWKL